MNGKCHQDLGPEVLLKSTLPLSKYLSKLQKCGWKAEGSDDAGRFLCDYALTTSLVILTTSVFFHVPPLDLPYSQEDIDRAVLNLVEIGSEMLMSSNSDISS